MAHESWYSRQSSVYQLVRRQAYLRASSLAPRCFLEWMWFYQKHRHVARLWRWLGRGKRIMQQCFNAFLRSVQAGQQHRLQLMEKLAEAATSSVAKSSVDMAFCQKLPAHQDIVTDLSKCRAVLAERTSAYSALEKQD